MYSYALTKEVKTIAKAKKDLQEGLDKSYELYNNLLRLIVDLTDLQDRRLDDAKNKFLPSEEDLHPNTRFIDNELAKLLRENEELNNFIKDNPYNWRDDEIFLRLLLDKVLNSEDYANYMSMEKTDFASDCELWRNLMKKIIIPDEDLLDQLESQSVYWTDDDLDIMGQFVAKTIKKIEDKKKNPILPKYKDSEDSEFGEQLFINTISQKDENNKLIDKFVKTEKWEAERIALMDRIVMCTAITEIKCFDKIPTTVTLNEYIEIAKNYSSPKDGQFVNGILNSVISYLKDKGEINKP
jgi:N utilization substance protein B